MDSIFQYLISLLAFEVRVVVTLEIVSDVLHVPRVEYPNYLGCECLRIVSKDELIFAFCEHPADWGDCQFTLSRKPLSSKASSSSSSDPTPFSVQFRDEQARKDFSDNFSR